jgi:hypothetical protein
VILGVSHPVVENFCAIVDLSSSMKRPQGWATELGEGPKRFEFLCEKTRSCRESLRPVLAGNADGLGMFYSYSSILGILALMRSRCNNLNPLYE